MESMNLYVAEIAGTAIFMVLGLGVCANIFLKRSGMCGSGGIMAAIGWGLSMVSVAVCFGPVSGVHCNPARNCLAEAVATFCLMFILLSLGHQEPAGGVAMFFVFCGVAAGVMSFGGLTGYAINPARDFMPRLVYTLVPIKGKGKANWGYAWIPIVGPIVGALGAALLYRILF